MRTDVIVHTRPPPNIPAKPSGGKTQHIEALRAVAAECPRGPTAVTEMIRERVSFFYQQFFVLLKRFDFASEPIFGFLTEAPDLEQLAIDIGGYIQLLEIFFNSRERFQLPLDTVKAFLGRFPYMKDYLGPDDNTLLYIACRWGYYDVAEFLLQEMCCNPNFQSASHGGTALHGACYGGQVRCVALLMDAGASPIVRNLADESPGSNARYPDPRVKDSDKTEILKLIATAASADSWERFDGNTWKPFPKESQDLLSSKISSQTPFLVTLEDRSFAEVDPARFKLSGICGEQMIRWRTRALPSGLPVQFQYFLNHQRASGWITFPAAPARTLSRCMEQAREGVSLSGFLSGQAMTINLTSFDIKQASSSASIGHFRWVPCVATDDRDSAAALGLVDEVHDDSGAVLVAPRAPPRLPSKVVLELRCGQPLSDNIPTLYKFFRTTVTLHPGPVGVVLVVTNSRDEPTVHTEIQQILHQCQSTHPRPLAADINITRPPAPSEQLSTVLIPLNSCSTLRSFLLSQHSGIEESILAYDMFDKFRFRLFIDETNQSAVLEVRGSPAQVVLMQTQVARFDYLAADVNAMIRQTCEKIDQVAIAGVNSLSHTLSTTAGASISGRVADVHQVFLRAYAARTREITKDAKASVASTLHDQLKRSWLPAIVKDREGTGLTALTTSVRTAAQTVYRDVEVARRMVDVECHALKEAFESLMQDLPSHTTSSSRLTLDNHLARLMSGVPRQACPEFHEKIAGLLRAAVILRDACVLQLPLYQRSNELLELINNNDVVSLKTGTGTGKSSLLPPLLTEAYKRIAVTQPRRLPCRSIAKRVDNTFSVPLCGWMMANESVHNDRPIIYVTEGLLREWLQACLPGASSQAAFDFDVLVLDEVHERSWNMDLCVGLLAALMVEWKKRGRTVKIILASATIDTEVLRPFESLKPHIKVAHFSLEMQAPFPVRETVCLQENPVQLAMDLFRKKQRLDQILVFLPTVPEVREAVSLFNSMTNTTSYGLFANQTATEQNEFIANGSVFFSTNIAETSLTFPHLRYVIDTGTTNESRFQPTTGLVDLLTDDAPRSALQQRKGRLGRTQQGDYYALYDPAKERREHRQPQVLLTDLLDIDFSLRRSNSSLRSVLKFLPSAPPEPALKKTDEQLGALGLLQADGKLLPEMIQFPNLGGARITAATYVALKKHNCGHDLICLAAMLRALPSSCPGLIKGIPARVRIMSRGMCEYLHFIVVC
jgi:hypothetical protein